MSEDKLPIIPETTVQAPRPSSPRKFFARLYGHLEEPRSKVAEGSVKGFESESSSDVEVEEDGREGEAPTVWAPAPLPLCPRPLMLPHQQLAFGAGLAAFCEYVQEADKDNDGDPSLCRYNSALLLF